MNILWLSWKDRTHPQAGGAEVVQDNLARRLAADGHSVTVLTAGYPDAKPEETLNGYRVVRVGGRWTVYWAAWRYFRRELRDWPELVIEEVNTFP
jgi:choline dehydrogenase-like flavoprotein